MYWPRIIFEVCARCIGLLTLKQLRFGYLKKTVDKKDWEVRVGVRIAHEILGKIKEWGLINYFDVFTLPNRTPFQISVFVLDPLTPAIWGFSHQRGVEVFRVQVKYPNFFRMTIFGGDKESLRVFDCKTKEPIREASEILFYVLSTIMVEKAAK